MSLRSKEAEQMLLRLSVVMLFWSASVYADTYVITTSNFRGGGSLVEGLTLAQTGQCSAPCSLVFNIRGPVPRVGYFTVEIDGPINFAPGMTLDGESQTHFSGDTNTGGPEIYLDASRMRIGAGLTVDSGGVLRNVAIGNVPADAVIVGGVDALVERNYIGIDPTGFVAASNGMGVTIIGEGAVVRENVIGANNAGITVVGRANRVLANIVGADPSGVVPFPNNVGVDIRGADSIIGTTDHLEGNLIVFNLLNGVQLVDSGVGNSIRGNSICCNGSLGIDLVDHVDHGVTANDPFDNDTGRNRGRHDDDGTNNLQNYPVLVRAVASRTGLSVVGRLNSEPNSVFDVDFYAAATADVSGYGEGEQFLGTIRVATDGNGDAAFETTLSGAGMSQARFITATASRAMRPLDTSEFSRTVEVRHSRRRAVSH